MEYDRTINFSVDVTKGFDDRKETSYDWAIVKDENFEDGVNFVSDMYNDGVATGDKKGFKRGLGVGVSLVTFISATIACAVLRKDEIKKSIEDLKSRAKARKAKKNAKDA